MIIKIPFLIIVCGLTQAMSVYAENDFCFDKIAKLAKNRILNDAQKVFTPSADVKVRIFSVEASGSKNGKFFSKLKGFVADSYDVGGSITTEDGAPTSISVPTPLIIYVKSGTCDELLAIERTY